MKKIFSTAAATAALMALFATAAFAAVSMEQAKKTALQKAGANGNVTMLKQKRDDSDRFGMVYEFEFLSGGYKHEAEVCEATGELVKYEMEKR